MMPYRVLALDYDGTLVAADRPEPAVLDALVEARAKGLRLVLVTGRRLEPLLELVPDARARFDAIVTENGAVLVHGDSVRTLAPPVAPELADALLARGVPIERGHVLLATFTAHAAVALAEITRLGLDVQLVHNRSALMLLPAGVTKGTGLFHALGELGVSYHNTVAVGDAENDHALLERSELAVAVANAIPSLQAHADVVLGRPAGEGIIELLRGPILDGRVPVPARRWQLDLGFTDAGARVRLPTSPSTILIAGESGVGKSHLAALVADGLLRRDYAVCILDPEGDYEHLAGHRGVAYLGGAAPSPDEVSRVLRHRFGSAVFDTSQVSEEARLPLLDAALRVAVAERTRSGTPHWLILDEAHLLFGPDRLGCELFDAIQAGLCLITYRPEDLCERARAAVDATLTLGDLDRRHVVLEGRLVGGRTIELTTRGTGHPHVRHRHKYAHARLPAETCFYFRRDGRPVGLVAANLREFADDLRTVDDAVIRHHIAQGDFSRWVGEVIRDEALARALRSIEETAARPHAGPYDIRAALAHAIESRYLAA